MNKLMTPFFDTLQEMLSQLKNGNMFMFKPMVSGTSETWNFI